MQRMALLSRTLVFVLVIQAIASAGAAQAQETGRQVVISDSVDHDLYAAGRDVDVRAAVNGDLVAAGRSVRVDDDVSEDVIAAGRSVSINGRVGDDVRLAGRTVTVSDSVAGHGVIAGREIRLESGSHISDWAWLAGTEIKVLGTIGGDLRAFGREIEIAGTIDGDVELAGEELRVSDGAVINGNLTWRSDSEPDISDGAIITGEILQGEPLDDFDHDHDMGFGGTLFALISVLIAAGLLYTLFGSRFDTGVKTVREGLWKCIGIGFLVLVAMPVLTALLFATGIGALLGGLVLMTYPVVLLLGSLTGVIMISRLGLARFGGSGSRWKDWGAIAAVTLVISVLYVVPPIGVLAATLVMLLGIGVLWTAGARICRA
jgi:hypothetical protein